MVVVIDGSIGEGGGQILRTALGLAAVLGKPVKIINIRAKRRNPGLQRQHLTAVRALAEIANARVEGDRLGSTELYFEPRMLRGGEFRFDIGTAGSTTLILQALLPVLPFLPRRTTIEIRGGTDVPWSPPIDYVRFVLLRALKMMGIEIEIELVRRGHYPRGGGIIRIQVEPTHSIKPIQILELGVVKKVQGRSHCVKLPKHVAERQANAAREIIFRELGVEADIELEYYEPSKDPHLGPGSGIVLYVDASRGIMGADALGEKGKPAEQVGREAAQKLVEEVRSGAGVDRHLGDMLISLAALASGISELRVSSMTMHAWTVIRIVRQLVNECEIIVDNEEIGKPFTVLIRGIGLTK